MEGIFIFGVVIAFLLCFAVASLWDNKGHSYAGGFWFSFFLTPLLGLIVGLLMQNAPREQPARRDSDGGLP